MKPSSIVTSDASDLDALLIQRGVAVRLPKTITTAIEQSGILEDGRDLAWLNDRRVVRALMRAHAAHGKKKRNFGGKPRLVHEMWCAHNMYHDEGLQEWLRKKNLSPVMGAFLAAVHDGIENPRDVADKKGLTFDAKAVVDGIARIWGDPQTNKMITDRVKHLTDKPGFHGAERSARQKAKSFAPDGRCLIDPLTQYMRYYDKLSHVHLDAREYVLGTIPPAKIAECRTQAEMKSFVCDLPVAQGERAERYRAEQKILGEFALTKKEVCAPKAAEMPVPLPHAWILAAFSYNSQMMLCAWEIGRKTIAAGIKSLKKAGFDI